MDINIYKNPAMLLSELIRFNTANPPGREKDCCAYIKALLDEADISTRIYALDQNRPNLWAEIKSDKPSKPPLLLYGHIDVVPADGNGWSHAPFAGEIQDDYIYGRGAVDMKSAVAIFICVILKIKLEHIKLDYDLFLLVLSDEEDTGKFGAKFMVENHSGLFSKIGCALGEMGGYSFHMGRRFYPVMCAEKQCAAIEIEFHGTSGHGSAKHFNTAMEKMSKAVIALCRNRLATRITPEVSFMLSEFAKGVGGIKGIALKLMANPLLTNILLDILKDECRLFDNLLHNSVNVTIVNGGNAVNVVPGNVHIGLDLRVLPGCSLETALSDIKRLLNEEASLSTADYEMKVIFFDKNDFKPDLRYYDSISRAILEADPEGIPFPSVFAAVTDGRILSQAGVMTYGFVPMRLPADFDFAAQAHAVDERLPIDALPFGIDTLLLFMTKYY